MSRVYRDARTRRWVAYCTPCGKVIKVSRSRRRARAALLRHDVRKHPEKV